MRPRPEKALTDASRAREYDRLEVSAGPQQKQLFLASSGKRQQTRETSAMNCTEADSTPFDSHRGQKPFAVTSEFSASFLKETEYHSKTIEETKIESFQSESRAIPSIRFDSSAV